MKCSNINVDGDDCGANAINNSQYCFTHDPTMKQKHLKAAAKGGQSSGDVGGELLPQIPIKRIPDVVVMLEDTLNRVRITKDDGSMDIRVANCIGYLSGQLIKAIEVSDIATRLEIVERVIFERKSILKK
jgi:hypothetical protein